MVVAWSNWHLEKVIFASRSKRNFKGVRVFVGYPLVMLCNPGKTRLFFGRWTEVHRLEFSGDKADGRLDMAGE